MPTGLIDVSAILGISPILLALILVWSLAWKGLALWKSARKNHLIWFIALLVVNTLGILEILYIFAFSELKFGKGKKVEKKLGRAKKKR